MFLKIREFFAHHIDSLQEDPVSVPPRTLKIAHIKPETVRPAVDRFSIDQLEYWRSNTADPWVLTTLNRGYTLQFRRRPPRFSRIVPTVVRDAVRAEALSLEICSLLEKGAIEKVHPLVQRDGFYSTYFLVPKKDGGFRQILDLRLLNLFLKVLPFRMLRTADVLRSVTADDWFVSVDLKDAYFHVPIAIHHRKFLRFSFLNQAYQFKVLPFGLSLAPRVFTRCVSAALSPLWMRGMRILPYLDDWLLCAPTQRQAVQDSRMLLRHVQKLGFSVNEKKSRLVPSQATTFIGMTLNSSLMSASLSQERVTNILQLLALFRPGVSLQYEVVLRLIGMLTAATVVIPLGLLHLRPLQLWNNSLRLDPTRHRHRLVVISHRCICALRRWRQLEFLKAGVPLGVVPSRRELVTTDASLTGWGATWNRRGICGHWTPIQATEHINLLELRAVFLALKYFMPVLAGRHVLVRSDNTSTVFHLNHQGGTRSRRSLRLTHEILTWCQPRLASLRAAHIPGVCNQTADALSRDQVHPGEWRLHPDVVQEIWLRFGRAEVDLFASERTTHCRLWFTRTEVSSPLGQDALSHEWPDCLLYAFPPIPLLWETLHRISLCKHRVLLVAPRWPARPWFPLLLRLLTGNPWKLPPRKDLLSQLEGSVWHPDPAHLQLWVWPLG